MLIRVEWRLAIIVYLLVPIMGWFAIKYRKKMNEAFKDVREKLRISTPS